MLGAIKQQPLVVLLKSGSALLTVDMALIVMLSGLSNAGLLAIFNGAAENASNEEANGRYLAMFAVAIVLYVTTQRQIMFRSITQVEELLDGIRVRVAERLRSSELQDLEQMGRAEILGVVARATQTISQAASTLAVALQAIIMVTFSVIYLASLSPTAFFITVGMSSIGIYIYLQRQKALNVLLIQAQASEDEFLGLLTHLIDGFKEIKLRLARGLSVFSHLKGTSTKVKRLKTTTGHEFSGQIVFAQLTFYMLLAGVVFLLPRVSAEYSQVVLQLTTAILFIIGPLSTIVGSIPVFASANVAADSILKMEQRLVTTEKPRNPKVPNVSPYLVPFSNIVIDEAAFSYPIRGTVDSFKLGPISLEVNAGEILFIVGGNGSGKSTLLKNLTGLYFPQTGSVSLDNVTLTPETADWYRSHFSAVFGDYHLFTRLYGLEDVSNERVNELLELLQISDKTAFENGQFSTLDLSQGQRKRLAMLVALAEDRPILVLDEWAADQDPPFRRFFYEELLPMLRDDGKTIVAVTHDDKYFGCADRVVKMDYGAIVPYESN